MNAAVPALLLLMAAPLGAAPAEHFRPSTAEAEILELERARAASLAGSDSSVIEKILADDVVWVRDGEVLNKQQAVAGAAQGPHGVLSDTLEYAHVRFFGDIAVVQGSALWTQKGHRTGHVVWTDTWLWRDDRWQIIAAEDDTVERR